MDARKLIPLLLVLLLIPTANAAPDTPPSITWESAIPGTSCTRTGNSGARGISLILDSADNVYIMSRCDTAAQAGFDTMLVTRITSTGQHQWTSIIGGNQVLGVDATITPGGLATEPGPNGHIVACWSDSNSGSTNNGKMMWINKQTGASLGVITGADTALLGGGTTDTCFADTSFGHPHAVTVTVQDSATLNYYLGGPASLIALRCTNYDELSCTRTFVRNGEPSGEYMVSDGPATGDRRYVYQCDNSPTMTVRRVDPVDGTSDATRTYTDGATDELRWCGRLAGTTPHVWFTFKYDATNDRYKYEKLNATTLASISAVLPTEPTIQLYNTLDLFGHDVDGDDNLFYCGRAIRDSDSFRHGTIMKVSSATTSQRWNITHNDLASATASESYVDCRIGSDGAIYALKLAVSSTGVATTEVHKYAGAGVARTTIDFDFDGFPDSPTSTSTTTPTSGIGIVRLIQTRTADAWGVSLEAAGWMIGAIFFGFMVYKLGRRAPLITATMILLISIVLVFIELWPWWILLLEAFLIVVFAGVALFERGDESGSE